MHELFKKYELTHLSASQIKTLKRSPFTWVCQKVLGMRSPATEATAFGTFIHENFEERLKAKVDKLDIKVSEGVKEFYVKSWEEKLEKFYSDYKEFCPEWPDGVELEFSFKPDEDLPPFIGKIDAITWEPVLIQDHKTVGNKRYAPQSEEDLMKEDQLIIYAAWVFSEKPELEALDIQHDQLFKKIKRKPVNILRTTITKEYTEERLAQILNDAKRAIEILEVYDNYGIEGVAKEYAKEYEDTKWDFGGCPLMDFFDECRKKKVDIKIEEKVQLDKGSLLDLHELVGKARKHFVEQGLTKFDLADAVVEAVIGHVVEAKPLGVFLRAGMINGGDLIYNQLMNQLAENGISVFERIN